MSEYSKAFFAQIDAAVKHRYASHFPAWRNDTDINAPCPTCSADPGALCRTRGGNIPKRIHATREAIVNVMRTAKRKGGSE